jgi:hypothetical protein
MSEKLDKLRKAYDWETDRMQAWADSIGPADSTGPGEQDPVKKILNDAWIKYFKLLKDSNLQVIDACNKTEGPNPPLGEQEAINIIKGEVRVDIECTDVRDKIIEYLDGP